MRFIPLVSAFLLMAATAQAGPNVKALGKQFRKLDANRDESLSADEFAKLLPAKLTRNNPLGETQAMMFYSFDEDASEGIDLGEWIEAKTANGSDSSPYFSDEVQDELNANGDGTLTWKEFSRVISKYVSSKTARAWFGAITSTSSSYSGSSLSLGGGSYGSSYTLSGGTLTVTVGGSSDWNFVMDATTFFETGNFFEAGNISDSAPIVSGSTLTLVPSDGSTTVSGTPVLDSTNTYTGSTTVSSGSLDSSYTVDSGVSLSVVSGFDFADAGTLTLNFSGTLISTDFTSEVAFSGIQQFDAFGSYIFTPEMIDANYLLDPVSETSASLIDQGSAPVSE